MHTPTALVSTLHYYVQIDVDFEEPLAEVLALTAAQQRRKHGRSKQQGLKDSKHELQESQPAPADASSPSPMDSTDRLNSDRAPDAVLESAGALSHPQQRYSAAPKAGLHLGELRLGCIGRVMSRDFKEALLPCQAGERAIQQGSCLSEFVMSSGSTWGHTVHTAAASHIILFWMGLTVPELQVVLQAML